MESALTPREMQARIRGGATPAQVAEVAGVPLAKVEVFAGPVLAEREFIANQARAQHVRRGAQTVPYSSLGELVSDRLVARGIPVELQRWDAWKTDRRKWTIQLAYDSGKAHREALFAYDQDGRFSVPLNEDARWLVGLHSASHGPQPGRRSREDAEPTVGLNDDIALVRVVQPPADPDDAEDAYAEADLAEVDGVLDFVPRSASQMDLLYDMLSSLAEDSVQIYSGLITANRAPDAPADEPAAADQPTPTAEPGQPSLIDGPAEDGPAKPKSRRKRAQVPSWDEIVFGSPKGR